MENDLFVGELGSIGQNEVDFELGRDRGRGWRARLHEGERGLGWVNVRNRPPPGGHKRLIGGRRGGGEISGEPPRSSACSGGCRSAQQASCGVTEHGCINIGDRSARKSENGKAKWR